MPPAVEALTNDGQSGDDQASTTQPIHQRGMLMDNAASALKGCPRLSHVGSGQRTRRLTTWVGPVNVHRG